MQALTIIVAAAFTMSTALFVNNVAVQKRRAPGQLFGLTLTSIAVILFLPLYADRLPGKPTGLRHIFQLLPGVSSAAVRAASPVAALWVLIAMFLVRSAIYVRLFVVPAMTMTDEEYNGRDEVEGRANDHTAPVLAYASLTCVLAVMLGTVYSLGVAPTICIAFGIAVLYVATPLLRHLEKAITKAAVNLRIALRNAAIALNGALVALIVAIGRLELWRTRRAAEDAGFYERLERRLADAKARTDEKNRADRERLRRLLSSETQRESAETQRGSELV